MKLFTLAFSLLFVSKLFAKDITHTFNKYYDDPARLSQKDLSYLMEKEIILVPGILSEVFSWEDQRVLIDFAFLTSDYFSAQVRHLKHILKLPTQKLLSSSKDVSETKDLIAEALQRTRANHRKAVIITHSLGGLALVDHLLEADEADFNAIEGIIFLQSPFYGSPIATVFLDNPYHADKWLKPFLPFFHTSIETIHYLSVAERTRFMNENKPRIKEILKKIPSVTFSGIANGHRSLFRPAVEVIKHGCILNAFARCLSARLYRGPYDLSDGMVPLNSSRLDFIDSVVLDGADHGEPIVRLPFHEVSKVDLTEAMLKLLLERSRKASY